MSLFSSRSVFHPFGLTTGLSGMLYLIDQLRDLICKFLKNPGYGWPHYVEETNVVEYMLFLCVKYHDLILSYTIVLLHHNFCALHMFLSETHTIILFSYWYGNRSMQWHVCNIVCKIRMCGAESHHNGVSYGVPQGTMCSLILIIYNGLHRTGGSEFVRKFADDIIQGIHDFDFNNSIKTYQTN